VKLYILIGQDHLSPQLYSWPVENISQFFYYFTSIINTGYNNMKT